MDLESLKAGLITFFLSMLPVTELRGSIPYAVFVLDLPLVEALIWSVLGNIVPVFFLLLMFPPVINFLFKKSPFLKKHLEVYFNKLHMKHSEKFNQLGAIFLALFVAIPLPVTGSWTGALLAYLFNIPYWFALASISLGVIIAGIVVAFFSGSLIELFRFLF